MHDEHKINTLLGDCACLFAVCLSVCQHVPSLKLHNLCLPYIWDFLDTFFFSGFRIVSGGDFLIFQKCPGFWPLSIVCGDHGCSWSLSPHGMWEAQESC